jgi:flagellar biosynthetic protein FliR
MDFDAARVLAELYGNIDVFMLVMVRMIGFMIIMPVFAGQTMPTMARAGFALACSAIVMSTGFVSMPEVSGPLEYALLIVNEFLAGFLIGFVCNLMFSIFHMFGQQTDFKIGFTMVSVNDPITQIQTPITGNLFYFTFLVFFVSQGGLRVIVLYVLETYVGIPLGNAFIIGNEGLTFTVLNLLSTYLEMGMRFALPIIAVITIVDVMLGILVKAVPQMNVFVVGMPMKVGIGLFTIMLLIPFWHTTIYNPFWYRLEQVIMQVIREMVPI